MLLNCGVREDSWESLGLKEIQPVHPKGSQSWIFIGRTDAEAETPILWPADAENWLTGKDSNAEKDWRQEAKGTTDDEMVGWHHRLDRHEFEQVPVVCDGQGSLACCSPWGHKESDTTERLNWTDDLQNLELHSIPGTTQRESKREQAWAWVSAFTGVKGGGYGFLWAHSSLANLKERVEM